MDIRSERERIIEGFALIIQGYSLIFDISEENLLDELLNKIKNINKVKK